MIVLADVGIRVFKQSQHVVQCCFYGNPEESLGLIFTQNSLRNCSNVVTFVRHYGARWMQTMENAKMHSCCYCSLPSWKYSQSHKQEQRELKQWGRERQRERYKTIDLITDYNHFMWECSHLAHRSPENKRNVGIGWAKSLTGFKLDATYANIMQHSPTWYTKERNMFCPTCWHNMLRSFARALMVFLKINVLLMKQ